MKKTTVVHKSNKHDIYIGRGSKWGNPFVMYMEFERNSVIKKYEEYILSNPELFEQIVELRGKILGCYCRPKICHGDVLAKYADMSEDDFLEVLEKIKKSEGKK